MRSPFALRVYQDFLNGKSITKLSGELGIPAERIEDRLRAAAQYLGDAREEPEPRAEDCETGRVVRRIVMRF